MKAALLDAYQRRNVPGNPRYAHLRHVPGGTRITRRRAAAVLLTDAGVPNVVTRLLAGRPCYRP